MKNLKIDNREIEVLNDIELSNDIEFIRDYLNDTSIFNEYRQNVKCFRKILKIKNTYSDIDYLTIIRDMYYTLCLHSGALKDTISCMVNYKSIIDVIIDNDGLTFEVSDVYRGAEYKMFIKDISTIELLCILNTMYELFEKHDKNEIKLY